MINFENILNKYNIICNDNLFYDKILRNFHYKNFNEKKLYISPTEDDLDIATDILVLGNELKNSKILKKIIVNKAKLNIYTLSQLDSDYLKNKFQINSEYLLIPLKNDENASQKLIYFHKDDNEKLNKHFTNYITQNDKPLLNIKKIKFIYFENINYIFNPFINIFISNNHKIEYINFYFLNFIDIVEIYDTYNNKNQIKKYHFYKRNFIRFYVYLKLLSECDSIEINIKNSELNNTVNNIFENNNGNFLVISDDKNYLDNLNNHICLKLLITDDILFKKMGNNYIALNSLFFNKDKINEIKNNKYNPEFLDETDHIDIIICDKKEDKLIKEYLKLYDKYKLDYNITIYSDFHKKHKKLKEYKIKNNTKIIFSKKYKFNIQELCKYNVDLKEIDKLSVLVSSTQYPGYGGAATNAYNILKYFRKNNKIDTNGIFIDTSEDIYEKTDPENIGKIIGLNYRDFNFEDIYDKIDFRPDIAFCKNCMAPKIIKKIFPNCIIIFLVSGLWGFSTLKNGANTITDFTPLQKDPEIKSIEKSNLVICNSYLTINYFKKIYSQFIKSNLHNFPVDTTKYNEFNFTDNNVKKDIDIIICASNVNRPVKNIKFIRELFNTGKFNKYKIVVIGENTEELFKGNNVTIFPLISQNEVRNLLIRSKIILIPSLFDSNSNVFREAIFSNCIPFISINVACPLKYPEFFIVENYELKNWYKRIKYILKHYEKIFSQLNLKKHFKNNDNLLDFIF